MNYKSLPTCSWGAKKRGEELERLMLKEAPKIVREIVADGDKLGIKTIYGRDHSFGLWEKVS